LGIRETRFDVLGVPSTQTTDFQKKAPDSNLRVTNPNVIYDASNIENVLIKDVASLLPPGLGNLKVTEDMLNKAFSGILGKAGIDTKDLNGSIATLPASIMDDLNIRANRLLSVFKEGSALCNLFKLGSGLGDLTLILSALVSLAYALCITDILKTSLSLLDDNGSKKALLLNTLGESWATNNANLTLDVGVNKDAKNLIEHVPNIHELVIDNFSIKDINNSSHTTLTNTLRDGTTRNTSVLTNPNGIQLEGVDTDSAKESKSIMNERWSLDQPNKLLDKLSEAMVNMDDSIYDISDITITTHNQDYIEVVASGLPIPYTADRIIPNVKPGVVSYVKAICARSLSTDTLTTSLLNTPGVVHVPTRWC